MLPLVAAVAAAAAAAAAAAEAGGLQLHINAALVKARVDVDGKLSNGR